MRRMPLLCTLFILIAVVAVPAAYSVNTTQPAEPSETDALATTEQGLPLQGTPEATAVSSERGRGKNQSVIIGGQFQDLALACTWYDISCSNGTTDECCGSESSCLVYCSEVCGEPCVVAN